MTILSLIGEWRSRDTEEVAERIYQEAAEGKIIGLAFVVLRKRRRYSYGFTGTAFEDPLIAIGASHRLLKALTEHEERLFMNGD
jgi:hypothetical protein